MNQVQVSPFKYNTGFMKDGAEIVVQVNEIATPEGGKAFHLVYGDEVSNLWIHHRLFSSLSHAVNAAMKLAKELMQC